MRHPLKERGLRKGAKPLRRVKQADWEASRSRQRAWLARKLAPGE